MAKNYTRGQLARAAGVLAETVRFYEGRGLLREPERDSSGYRIYLGEDLRRLRFIRRAKELGFQSREVEQLLALRVDKQPDQADRVRFLAQSKADEIAARVRDLQLLEGRLRELVHCCEERVSTEECPILDALSGAGVSNDSAAATGR